MRTFAQLMLAIAISVGFYSTDAGATETNALKIGTCQVDENTVIDFNYGIRADADGRNVPHQWIVERKAGAEPVEKYVFESSLYMVEGKRQRFNLVGISEPTHFYTVKKGESYLRIGEEVTTLTDCTLEP